MVVDPQFEPSSETYRIWWVQISQKQIAEQSYPLPVPIVTFLEIVINFTAQRMCFIALLLCRNRLWDGDLDGRWRFIV